MKKVFVILVALIGFGIGASAQENNATTVDNIEIEITENFVSDDNAQNIIASEFDMFANNEQIIDINTNSTSNCWSIWSTTDNDGYCVAGSEIRYDNYCGEVIQGALIYKYYNGKEWSSKQCTTRTLQNNRGNATLMGNSFSTEGKCFVNFYQDKTCRDVGY